MEDRKKLYKAIYERTVREGLYTGNCLTLLMDIEGADKKFHLRLEDWLNADAFDFAHDLIGIVNNIERNSFPATNFGFFLPRFAENTED